MASPPSGLKSLVAHVKGVRVVCFCYQYSTVFSNVSASTKGITSLQVSSYNSLSDSSIWEGHHGNSLPLHALSKRDP